LAPTDTSAKALFKKVKADDEADRKDAKAEISAQMHAAEIEAEVEELRAMEEALSWKSEEVRVETEKVRARLRELDEGA
jgi:hypothetical protein